MASEARRGCGYRKVGGIYLVGGLLSVPCDRLPYKLDSCPVCGAGVHFTRAMTEINPFKLFGTHDQQVPVFKDNPELSGFVTKVQCHDQFRPCIMCDPTEKPAYIMMVGEKFYPTPDDFNREAAELGVSKRIPFIPKKLVLGETIIYLAHNKAVCLNEPANGNASRLSFWDENGGKDGSIAKDPVRLVDAEKREYALGIFRAFIPQRIEKIYWQSELDNMSEDEKKDLAKRGITPVGVPDGDKDHA